MGLAFSLAMIDIIEMYRDNDDKNHHYQIIPEYKEKKLKENKLTATNTFNKPIK